MKRKKFLRRACQITAGTLFLPASCREAVQETKARTNWAGNYSYKAKTLYEPGSIDELIDLVTTLDKQKALGSKHCFNDIADSPKSQISTAKLNEVISIDESAGMIHIEAGIRYGDFAPMLDEAGFAMHNLASLPHISVGGAISTGTHGSGIANGNLSSACTSLELLSSDGTLRTIDLKDETDVFNGSVVGLGALGIITTIKLAIEPSYRVRQWVYRDLPLQSLTDHFDDIMGAGYSVSLFTDWQDQKINQVWVKRKEDEGDLSGERDFYGSFLSDRDLHPITELSAENCTPQMGVPGPWYERLPHFKMGFTPSSGEELQAEYFVARENAVDAILAIEKKKDLIYPQLFISEIRTIASDQLWLSPSYGRESVAIHFTLKPNWGEVQKILPVIENELAPYGVRPHWGKLFTMGSHMLKSRFPKMPDFMNLMQEFDPGRAYTNAFLDKYLYS